jgi:ketosteroid isomerase-like protein
LLEEEVRVSATDDLDAAIERHHAALAAFVTGDPEPLKAAYSLQGDVSLANPFGPPVRGWDQVAETMEHAAAHYREGRATGFEEVTRFADADLACTVEVERFETKVGGSEQPATVALRVTTIFRREDGGWKVAHRHADPILSARPAESIVQR